MKLPQRKKPGDPVLAEDWNSLLDAITARTPRPGSGLELIASSGGFAYSRPGPMNIPHQGLPPFAVIAIEKGLAEARVVTIKEGWVIERKPRLGDTPTVKFHIPLVGITTLDSIPRPQIGMSAGDTLWCRYQTDTVGEITGVPEIVVAAGSVEDAHYYPDDPEGPGGPGNYYVKLFRLDFDGENPMVKVYQQSDIEHWAQLWTGENVGYACRVYKEHKETENIYKFRSISGISPINVAENGDVIEVSFTPSEAETGSLTFVDCEGTPIEGKKVEWSNGLVTTAGNIEVQVPPCNEYGGEGVEGATGELIIRTDNPGMTYPDNIVGYVSAVNGIVTEIWGDLTFCCHPDLPPA